MARYQKMGKVGEVYKKEAPSNGCFKGVIIIILICILLYLITKL